MLKFNQYLLLLSLICLSFQKADVYFTSDISSSAIVRLFKELRVELKGNIGLKVHTGEKGGKYFLTPDFLQKIYDYTKGTFIECNTAYEASDKNYSRCHTDTHRKLLDYHGWTKNGRRMVIMDENPENNFNLTVDDPARLPNNIVGEHLKDFDSALVLAHFKGHGAGGYGGALKQLSIGFASQAGKTNIHTGGITSNWENMMANWTNQEYFTEGMGDAASTIVNFFRKRKGIAFINVIANISLHCDCAGASAPKPRIKDIGILASTDPVAIDKASIDSLKTYTDEGTFQLLEQIKFLKGENTIDVAERHGIGSKDYNFVDVDDRDETTDQPTDEPTDDSDKPTDQPTDKEEDKDGIDKTTFLIVVIILSCVCILLAVAFGIYCFKRNKMDTNIGSVSLVTKDEP